jgi:hypothetical protein
MEQVDGRDLDAERIRRLPHAIISLFQSWHEIHRLLVAQPPDAVSKLQSAAIMLRGVLSANFSDSLAILVYKIRVYDHMLLGDHVTLQIERFSVQGYKLIYFPTCFLEAANASVKMLADYGRWRWDRCSKAGDRYAV